MNFLIKLSNWYFTKSALPYWWVLIFDCLIVFFSTFLIYLLFHGVSATFGSFWPIMGTISLNLIYYLIGFRFFHTYSGILRYSTFVDIQNSFFSIILGTILAIISQAVFDHQLFYISITVTELTLSAMLSILMMTMMRMFVKYLYDFFFNMQSAKRTFIFGAKAGGVAIGKSIRSQKPSQYIIKGFISTQKDMVGKTLMGLKVYKISKDIVSQMVKMGVEYIIISPLKSDEFREKSELQKELIKAGIHIMMLPEAQEWDGKSEINHTKLKEVEIEDLLPREKIELDMHSVGALLRDKTILITGAAGSIGGEIVEQVSLFRPKTLVLVDQAETPMHDIRRHMESAWPTIKTHTIVTNICKEKRMDELFGQYRPDYVFHAAAYKHVPMMEDNPGEAVQNNIYGTKVVADMAVKWGTKKFVMISTDKAVNPTNVMGCSKRICELYVQSLDKAIKEGKIAGQTQFVTTRFGNVLGSNGSVIPIFREQIKRGGPVTVTDPNIIRYFMLIPEACKLVLEAGTMGNGGEIYVFDMGKPVKIVDLAQNMIDLSGAKNIEIKYTGLRHGEKLYEEVLNDEEMTKPTFHPKIKIATVREENYETVNSEVEKLYHGSFTYNDMEIVKHMKTIVPEFVSKNSKYEVLDN